MFSKVCEFPLVSGQRHLDFSPGVTVIHEDYGWSVLLPAYPMDK